LSLFVEKFLETTMCTFDCMKLNCWKFSQPLHTKLWLCCHYNYTSNCHHAQHACTLDKLWIIAISWGWTRQLCAKKWAEILWRSTQLCMFK